MVRKVLLTGIFVIAVLSSVRGEVPAAPRADGNAAGQQLGVPAGSMPALRPPVARQVPVTMPPMDSAAVYRMGPTGPAMALMPVQALLHNAGALQLSAEQHTQFQKLVQKHEPILRVLTDKVAATSQPLQEMAISADFDQYKLLKLATAAQMAESQLIMAQIEAWADLRGVLTGEQLLKVRTMFMTPSGPAGADPRMGVRLPPMGSPSAPGVAPAPAAGVPVPTAKP